MEEVWAPSVLLLLHLCWQVYNGSTTNYLMTQMISWGFFYAI